MSKHFWTGLLTLYLTLTRMEKTSTLSPKSTSPASDSLTNLKWEYNRKWPRKLSENALNKNLESNASITEKDLKKEKIKTF
jgi:hypothetical protein